MSRPVGGFSSVMLSLLRRYVSIYADYKKGWSWFPDGSGEPTEEADRGRHPGFARQDGCASGPGSLSLSFADLGKVMTEAEWRACTDPRAMIALIDRQGGFEKLWDFTVACCLRFRDQLSSMVFQRVVDLGDQHGKGLATWRMVDDALAEAGTELTGMEMKLARASARTSNIVGSFTDDADWSEARTALSAAEQDNLNRQIGLARGVLAFEFQDGAEAAAFISDHLLQWSTDETTERAKQADLLRQLVPDPSQRLADDEE